jgi:NAD(P)-dependent dehydrogenase (short-subunit alcohol dehydrogenase family)
MKWNTSDIPDLRDRVAVVTGANGGLGSEISLELARHRARVVLACRDQAVGEITLGRILTAVPDADVQLRALDLASLASIRRFADETLREHRRIALLINNAGVMALPKRRVTEDGFEAQLGINHLGHYALTALLLPALLAGREARVVTVTSSAHRTGRLRFEDLHAERRYSRWAAYSQSKLANLMFAIELQRRADAVGSQLTSIAVHPGLTDTPLQAGTPMTHFRRFMQPAHKGALPVLYAATALDVNGGELLGPPGLLARRRPPARMRASRAARDSAAAARLWQVSAELTRVLCDPAGQPVGGQLREPPGRSAEASPQ